MPLIARAVNVEAFDVVAKGVAIKGIDWSRCLRGVLDHQVKRVAYGVGVIARSTPRAYRYAGTACPALSLPASPSRRSSFAPLNIVAIRTRSPGSGYGAVQGVGAGGALDHAVITGRHGFPGSSPVGVQPRTAILVDII